MMRIRQRGLTMIEVLAAMVIFSAGAVVLFGWIGQTADRLARLSSEQSALFEELTALEYLRTVNPMRQPQGEEAIAGARFRWQSMPVGEALPSRGVGGTEGLYMVQLFKVQWSIDVAGSAPSERSLWLAGWRQVRSAGSVNPFVTNVQPAPIPAGNPAPR